MGEVPVSDTTFGGLRDVTRLRIRACDDDRHATALELQRALAEGRLTFDECSDRMAAAFASRFRDDLPPLTADLPQAASTDSGPPGWAVLGQMALTQTRFSLANVGRVQLLPGRLVRWGEFAGTRRGGGSSGGLRQRPVLRAAVIGLLVLGAILVGLLLLALTGMAVHHLLDLGHAHGGYHHHEWHHHGYSGQYDDYDQGDD